MTNRTLHDHEAAKKMPTPMEDRSDHPLSSSKLILCCALYSPDSFENKAEMLAQNLLVVEENNFSISEKNEMLGNIFLFVCRMACYRMPALFRRGEGELCGLHNGESDFPVHGGEKYT
jgi:hypothetical protein